MRNLTSTPSRSRRLRCLVVFFFIFCGTIISKSGYDREHVFNWIDIVQRSYERYSIYIFAIKTTLIEKFRPNLRIRNNNNNNIAKATIIIIFPKY